MTKEKCGIYVRLSRDEDKENYDSLLVQRDSLVRYADENNMEVYDIYLDDNVSGYLFDDRPEFNRMLEDLYSDKFDIVLAKDLSRIGRNNPRTLLFLEELSIKDKKLILTAKNYDSSKDDDDIVGIETWVNERYVKDISQKVRHNIEQMQHAGTLLIRSTYGYIKEDDKLVVDNQTAPIIKEIFQLYKEGYGYRKIANFLNERQYPTPSMVDGTKRMTTELWNSTHVSRILKNDIYTGVQSQRKTIRKRIKSKELNRLPEDKWIKINNHHEAIISKDDFDYVQSTINNRNQKKIRAGADKINLFAGFLYCHECKSPMFCVKNKRFATYYQCGNYFKYGTKACTSHRIMEKSLIVTILMELQGIVNNIREALATVDNTLSAQAKIKKNYASHIDKLSKDIENRKKEKMVVYKDKVKGLIDEEMYLELVKEIDMGLKTLNSQLDELQKLQDTFAKSEKVLKSHLDILESIIENGLLVRETIDRFINKIEINANKEIENIDWSSTIESMVQ